MGAFRGKPPDFAYDADILAQLFNGGGVNVASPLWHLQLRCSSEQLFNGVANASNFETICSLFALEGATIQKTVGNGNLSANAILARGTLQHPVLFDGIAADLNPSPGGALFIRATTDVDQKDVTCALLFMRLAWCHQRRGNQGIGQCAAPIRMRRVGMSIPLSLHNNSLGKPVPANDIPAICGQAKAAFSAMSTISAKLVSRSAAGRASCVRIWSDTVSNDRARTPYRAARV